jgi:hypothetical protein
MSNLVKYIQTINENEQPQTLASTSVGNDGEKYEKLITIALQFLILKDSIKDFKDLQEKVKKIQEDPEEIKELEQHLKDLEKIKEEIENEINKDIIIKKLEPANETLKKINSIITEKKISTDEKKISTTFTQVKSKKALNSRIETLTLILDSKNKFLDLIKNKFNKSEYDDFIKCYIKDEKMDNNYIGEPSIDYFRSYKIAKNIKNEIEEKSEIEEKKESKKILRVINIGSRNGQISSYWNSLFEKNIKSSKGKTDIIVETDNGNYNLSLKMEKNRFGTPKYVDIYTLILHGINQLLIEKYSPAIRNATQVFDQEKINKFNSNLIKILDIKENDQVDNYTTIINIAIILELILQDKKSNSDDQFIKDITDADVKYIEKIFEKFKSLTLTEDDINNKLLNKKTIDVLKREKINAINDFTAKSNRSPVKINYEDKTIKGETIKGEIVKLISIIKNVAKGENFFGSYTGEDDKLYELFNDNTKKYDHYKKLLTLRNTSKDATKKLLNILNSKKDYLDELFDKISDNEPLINFLLDNTNQNFIKKQIVEEVLTGKYKFNNPNYVATHILKFNILNFKIELEEINSNYINYIAKYVNIKFGFKSSSNKASPSLQIGESISSLNVIDESFFDTIKEKFNDLKLKVIKIITFTKNKVTRLLDFFGIRIKIKKATMPQWMIDKL